MMLLKWYRPCLVVVAVILAGFASAETQPVGSTTFPGKAADSPTTGPAVVAHFHLSGEITEQPQEDPFGLLSGQITSLKSLLDRLDKARKDDKVKAVVLTYDMAFMGLGQMEEVRNALMKFREVKKPVYVQVDSTYLGTGTYALLSAGSELVVDPMADLWVMGLYAESPYAKGLLDKIGVGTDFLQFEQYKSAAELLTRTEPSEPARENINWLLDSIYDSLLDMIAQGRGVPKEEVMDWIDAGIHRAPAAQSKRMVDSVVPREELLAQLKSRFGHLLAIDNRYGVEKQLTVDFTNPFAFFSVFAQLGAAKKKPQKDTVAIVYVEGAILPGYSQATPFGGGTGAFSGNIRFALEKAARDSTVKAVVLRVDSPGGSALASDIILRATKDLKGQKPLVVSMGNVAGSGGYYVSCGADEIFADETTLTASIGVIGGKLITTGMWDKLGINWVGYPRGRNADFMSSAQPFTEEQKSRMHEWMEDIYRVFKKHVVEGRGDRLKKPIEEIAGGRVFTGRQAKELGLVDQIGGLKSAVERAAERANLTEYDTRVIPEPKNPIEAVMEALSGEKGDDPADWSVSAETGGETTGISGKPLWDLDSPEWKTVWPLLNHLEPERAAALRNALVRIELIRREGVILMMPLDLVVR